jgi:LmbE family N-acetylglucosaminyl deacetylase
VSYDARYIPTALSLAVACEPAVELEALMADQKVTFEWNIVRNHPDHDRIERAVRAAAKDVPGCWVATISPRNTGWHLALHGSDERRASIDWSDDLSVDEIIRTLHRALGPRD